MTDYLTKWQPVADDVLSVLMANPKRWMEAMDVGITTHDFPPGSWRDVYLAVLELASAQKQDHPPLMDTSVATKAGAMVSVEWVAERIAAYDEWRESGFAEQLKALAAFGRGHRQLTALKLGMTQVKAALNDGLNIDDPVREVVHNLQMEQMTTEGEPVDLDALMAENKARMEGEPLPRVTTGIHLIDNWIGGMGVNEFLAGVAPYKMRKTSIMANVVLHRLREGDQVEVFSFDERRADFIYRLEAILMAEYMWNRNQYDHPLNNVSVKMLSMTGNKYKGWADPLRKAFEYAFDTLASFGKQCRIYDSRVCPATVASIAAFARLDASRYGDIGTLFVDHLQSLSGRAYKGIFDKVEEGAAELHLLRGQLDCRMWVLAQQNEAAIHGADEGGHSPNVKGGGGLAAKADTVLISKYMTGTITDPRYVRIEMRNARWEQSQVYGYVEIHPASGWITPRPVDSKAVNVNDELSDKIGIAI